MDVNTDSNARQRDNCNVDSHITAMHQAAAAPAASAAYRRRNALFLFEPDAHVHPWTEFKLFSLGAVHAYTQDTGDLSVAAQTFDTLVKDYSLTQFVDANDGLVHKPPFQGLPPGMATQAANTLAYYDLVYQDLIDWPNAADALNDDARYPEGATCCHDGFVPSNVSTPINAHVAHAHRRLAEMARWLERPEAEAAAFDAKADGIVAGLLEHLHLSGPEAAACDPPAPACFLDGLGPRPAPDSEGGGQQQQPQPPALNHTGVHATMYVVGCGLLTPLQSLELLPFLKAKSSHFPLYSAMASNFMLEGLYRMATAETNSSDAADLAFDIMTRDGHRSWLEMIAHNATMAIEHWYGTSIDRHTWSHPWSASPARIIPQWLMGVRPLEPAWRRVAVHPQPGTKLRRASMRVPTLRGEISLSFSREGAAPFALNLTLPGNTVAEVCLPTALLGAAARLWLDGEAVAAVRPADRPGQLCLPHNLGGGAWQVVGV